MKNSEYRGFISFSHKDSDLSLNLHRRLEHFRVPSNLRGSNFGMTKLGTFFRDREELAANAQLTEQIRDALSRSRCLIVICTLNSANSTWVQKEVETYLSVRPDGEIFAVIGGGEPPDCIPLPLRKLDIVAGDFRSHADGFEDGTLKLISGLLGLSFGNLKDRVAEETRKQKSRTKLTAISFALLALFALIGLVSSLILVKRSNLLAEAAIATSGEISDKAYAMGLNSGATMASVEDLLDFSREKLKELKQFNLQREELESRSAWVRLRFSHLYLQRREFAKALTVAEEVAGSMKGRKKYGSMLAYTGALMCKAQGLVGLERKIEAMSAAKFALNATNIFADTFVDFYETRLALSENERLYGETLANNNQSEQALDHLASAVRLLNELLKEFPNSATFPMRLAETFEIMGGIAQNIGDVNRASSWYGESATWYLRFLQYNKSDKGRCQHTMEIALKGSELFLQQANYQQAANQMKIAVNAMDIVNKQYPELESAKINLERAKVMLSQIERGVNPFTLDVTEQGKIGALLSRAQKYMEDGDRFAENGEGHKAFTSFLQSVKILRPLVEKNKSGKEGKEMLATSTMLAGASAVDDGDLKNARLLLQQSRDMWHQLELEFPSVPKYTKMKISAEKTLEGVEQNF